MGFWIWHAKMEMTFHFDKKNIQQSKQKIIIVKLYKVKTMVFKLDVSE